MECLLFDQRQGEFGTIYERYTGNYRLPRPMTPEDAHLVGRNRDLWAWFRWNVEVGEYCGGHSVVDSPPSGAVIPIKYVPNINWINVIRPKPDVII